MKRKRPSYYRSNNNIIFACYFHIIWSTKYRRPVLIDPIDARLKQIIQETCQEHQVILLALEVMPDHVHILVDVDPQFGVNRLMQSIKGRSSRFLRKEYPSLQEMPSLWSNSYCVNTTGRATLKVIKRYVERQKVHHANEGR